MTMTLEEKTQYGNEVKTALYDYLEKNDLMEAHNADVMNHLPGMYKHLEENQLVKYGLTYEFFCAIASEEFLFAMVRGIE